MENTFTIPERPWGEAEVSYLAANIESLTEEMKVELGFVKAEPDNNFKAEMTQSEEKIEEKIEEIIDEKIDEQIEEIIDNKIEEIIDEKIDKKLEEVKVKEKKIEEIKVVNNKATDNA